jgi:hypothetical protein
MTKERRRFEQWWDAEDDIPNDGPYTPDTPIQFAWAGWQAALAQSEQEQDGCPVCGSDVHDRDALDKAEREIERLRAWVKFTPPPQRKPLTDEEIWKSDSIMEANSGYGASFETLREIVRAIEAAHGIKD